MEKVENSILKNFLATASEEKINDFIKFINERGEMRIDAITKETNEREINLRIEGELLKNSL
jgi:hypothetical protein